MTNPQINPEETYALLVGIEKYTAGSGWNLNGPANDAIQFANWLLEKGVKSENIYLFVSPLDENRDLLKRTNITSQPANRENISDAINCKLLGKDVFGELLYVFWGGHGYKVNSENTRRILWYSDTNNNNYKSLDIESLGEALKTSAENRGFVRQICFIDACAISVGEEHDLILKWETGRSRFTPNSRLSRNEQFMLFASSEDEAAINDNNAGYGIFSRVVLDELKQLPEGPLLPADMDGFTETVDKKVREQSTQRPFFVSALYSNRTKKEWGNSPIKSSGAISTTLITTPSNLNKWVGREDEINQLQTVHWRRCGPETDIIRTLVIDPYNPKIIYAGVYVREGNSSGIYKSIDGGKSWKNINNGLTCFNIKKLVVSPHDGKIYAGTDSGLFFSTNRGEYWQIDERYLGLEVRCIALSQQDSNLVICGTGKTFSGTIVSASSASIAILLDKSLEGNENVATGDLHVSTDKTQTWITFPLKNINAAVISPQDHNVIYLGTSDDGVFRSLNRGMQWQEVSELGARNVFCLAVSPKNNYHVLAGTNNGLRVSLDGGDFWQSISEVGDVEVTSITFSLSNDNQIFVTTEVGIFESQDNGYSWQSINQGLVHQWSSCVVTSSNGTIYVGTLGGGVYQKEYNQLSWLASNSGLFREEMSGISLAVKNNNLIYLGTNFSIFRSLNGGNSWEEVGYFRNGIERREPIWSLALPPHPFISDMNTVGDGGLFISTDAGSSWQNNFEVSVVPIYAGTINGHIYKSIDGGNFWQIVGDLNGNKVLSLAISSRNINFIYAGIQGGGVFKSIDGGNSWNPVNNGLDNLQITCIAISNDSRMLYAGTAKHGLYKSEDGGASWDACGACGDGLPSYPISAIALSDQTSNLLYVATEGGGVYKTTTRGASWDSMNNGLINTQVTALTSSPKDDRLLYAGSSDGIFKSIDGGEHWQIFNHGLGENQCVFCLALSAENTNLLYAATQKGGGIFKILDVT